MWSPPQLSKQASSCTINMHHSTWWSTWFSKSFFVIEYFQMSFYFLLCLLLFLNMVLLIMKIKMPFGQEHQTLKDENVQNSDLLHHLESRLLPRCPMYHLCTFWFPWGNFHFIKVIDFSGRHHEWKSTKNHCFFKTKIFFLEMRTESISWVMFGSNYSAMSSYSWKLS